MDPEELAALANQTADDDNGGAVATLAKDGDESEDKKDEPETFRVFKGAVLALVGKATSDRRMFAKNIELSYRPFPLPMMWCEQTGYGHEQAFIVGAIENAYLKGGKLLGDGYFLNTEPAEKAAELVAHSLGGPSVDLADTSFMYTDEKGNELKGEELYKYWDEHGQPFRTITKAELCGATMVAIPAFGATTLSFKAKRETRNVSLVASAAQPFQPTRFAASLFEKPPLTGPTAPTYNPETGRYYGHIAVFGQCHRSVQEGCLTVPRSPSGYKHFHTAPAVLLDNGQRLPVGRFTVDTGHAPMAYGGVPAAAHYDNTGNCYALVRMYEDKWGLAFSGTLAPGADRDVIERGLAAPLSGDWRDFGEGLDFVAGLGVNTPGFAIQGRTDEYDREVALVASMSPPETTVDEEGDDARSVSPVDLQAAVAAALAADRAAQAEEQRKAQLAADMAAYAEITHPPTPREIVAAALEAVK